jgi:hypothetical protein
MIQIRKGQAPAHLARAEFSVRFRASFIDPEFRAEDPSIARLEEIAWQAYVDGRKAPFTRALQQPAGFPSCQPRSRRARLCPPVDMTLTSRLITSLS